MAKRIYAYTDSHKLEIYFKSIPLLQQMSISMVLLKLFEIRSVISKQVKSYEQSNKVIRIIKIHW